MGLFGVTLADAAHEPGMVLQREYREGRLMVWSDYLVDGEPVLSPVDIETLPVGKYRLI